MAEPDYTNPVSIKTGSNRRHIWSDLRSIEKTMETVAQTFRRRALGDIASSTISTQLEFLMRLSLATSLFPEVGSNGFVYRELVEDTASLSTNGGHPLSITGHRLDKKRSREAAAGWNNWPEQAKELRAKLNGLTSHAKVELLLEQEIEVLVLTAGMDLTGTFESSDQANTKKQTTLNRLKAILNLGDGTRRLERKLQREFDRRNELRAVRESYEEHGLNDRNVVRVEGKSPHRVRLQPKAIYELYKSARIFDALADMANSNSLSNHQEAQLSFWRQLLDAEGNRIDTGGRILDAYNNLAAEYKTQGDLVEKLVKTHDLSIEEHNILSTIIDVELIEAHRTQLPTYVYVTPDLSLWLRTGRDSRLAKTFRSLAADCRHLAALNEQAGLSSDAIALRIPQGWRKAAGQSEKTGLASGVSREASVLQGTTEGADPTWPEHEDLPAVEELQPEPVQIEVGSEQDTDLFEETLSIESLTPPIIDLQGLESTTIANDNKTYVLTAKRRDSGHVTFETITTGSYPDAAEARYRLVGLNQESLLVEGFLETESELFKPSQSSADQVVIDATQSWTVKRIGQRLNAVKRSAATKAVDSHDFVAAALVGLDENVAQQLPSGTQAVSSELSDLLNLYFDRSQDPVTLFNFVALDIDDPRSSESKRGSLAIAIGNNDAASLNNLLVKELGLIERSEFEVFPITFVSPTEFYLDRDLLQLDEQIVAEVYGETVEELAFTDLGIQLLESEPEDAIAADTDLVIDLVGPSSGIFSSTVVRRPEEKLINYNLNPNPGDLDLSIQNRQAVDRAYDDQKIYEDSRIAIEPLRNGNCLLRVWTLDRQKPDFTYKADTYADAFHTIMMLAPGLNLENTEFMGALVDLVPDAPIKTRFKLSVDHLNSFLIQLLDDSALAFATSLVLLGVDLEELGGSDLGYLTKGIRQPILLFDLLVSRLSRLGLIKETANAASISITGAETMTHEIQSGMEASLTLDIDAIKAASESGYFVSKGSSKDTAIRRRADMYRQPVRVKVDGTEASAELASLARVKSRCNKLGLTTNVVTAYSKDPRDRKAWIFGSSDRDIVTAIADARKQGIRIIR